MPATKGSGDVTTDNVPAAGTNGSNTRPSKRQASVYDAVAGRMDVQGFSDRSPRIKFLNGFPTSQAISGPLDVLLRRVTAPTSGRADVYLADQYLRTDQNLPDSELLKALHVYASDLYHTATPHKGKGDFRTLDETALIALGILVEEAAVQILGETGDMVLVEPEGFDSFVPETRATQLQIHGRVAQTETPPYLSEKSTEDSDDSELPPRKKRRPAKEQTI